MSAQLVKAAEIRAACDAGRTADDFGVLKFTAGTTHAANALPAAWSGRWVIMRASGGDVHFAFSKSSSAEVDSGVAATAAGASSKVGDVIPDGLSFETQRKLPSWGKTETMYFVRESSAASTTVYVALGDGDT